MKDKEIINENYSLGYGDKIDTANLTYEHSDILEYHFLSNAEISIDGLPFTVKENDTATFNTKTKEITINGIMQ